jgi:hypothetical protein
MLLKKERVLEPAAAHSLQQTLEGAPAYMSLFRSELRLFALQQASQLVRRMAAGQVPKMALRQVQQPKLEQD